MFAIEYLRRSGVGMELIIFAKYVREPEGTDLHYALDVTRTMVSKKLSISRGFYVMVDKNNTVLGATSGMLELHLYMYEDMVCLLVPYHTRHGHMSSFVTHLGSCAAPPFPPLPLPPPGPSPLLPPFPPLTVRES
jgi:hypothetical protein